MSFGENLTALRKAKGLSQEQFAQQLAVSRQTVSKWELDETTPDLDRLAGIADYFGVSIDSLVKGSADVPPKAALPQQAHPAKTGKDIAFLALKIGGILIGVLAVIDVGMMLVYFLQNGFPPL